MPKKLAKSIGFSIVIIAGLIISPSFARAASCTTTCPGGATCFPNPLRYCTIVEIVDNIATFLLYLAMVIAPLLILIGAYYLMVSGGDPKKVDSGKKYIFYAAIGFLIALGAKGVMGLIKGALGIE